MNLKEKILELKEKKNAIILAHYYQTPDIQDISDFLGDSLQLARAAENANAEIILFSGVHFMAETAKLLNPDKKVLIPDLDAGCSLSDSCPPDLFKQFTDSLPDHKVVSYINCSAEIKALSDVICTSSNAMAIVNSFPPDQPLIFAPDKNLGAYINEQTGRNMVLWNGSCMVHEIFSIEKLLKLKIGHPQAKIIAHPECEADLLKHADYIGSTTQLLKFTQTDPGTEYIVVTETGIIHQMILASPEKSFFPAPPNNSCACNDCPHMKKNTLEKIYMALQNEEPAIDLHPRLMAQAIKPLKKMLNISQTAGII